MPRPAVFFDRDNTLIANSDYLGDPEGVSLIAGAADAVARVKRLGFVTVVVSNQSGVARGFFGEEDVRAVNARMDAVLVEAHPDAVIDHHEFCPHHPDGTVAAFARDHPRRKPQPGMLLDAAETLELDLKTSWLIGDAPRDVEAGRRAGCRTILVRQALDTHSPAAAETLQNDPDYVASSLEDAVDFIEMQVGESAGIPAPAFAGESPRDLVDRDEADPRDGVVVQDSDDDDDNDAAVRSETPLVASTDDSARPATMITVPVATRPDAPLVAAPSISPVSSHLGAMKEAITSSAPPAGTDRQTVLLLERVVEELRRANDPPQDFSVARMLGGIVQGFAIAMFFAALMYRNDPAFGVLIGIAIFLQVMVSSLVLMGR